MASGDAGCVEGDISVSERVEVTVNCPRYNKAMGLGVYVSTSCRALYVSARGVCDRCRLHLDAYGFDPKEGGVGE